MLSGPVGKASPARLATISEKVWLLEKSNVRTRFLAFAGDQDRKRDRKKDKSCQSSYIQDEKDGLDLAAIKKRNRKKDGSCQSTISEEKTGFDLAAVKKRDRTRDRKNDGSCQSSITGEKPGIELAADKIRDRKKNGTCKSRDTMPVSV